MRIAYLITLMDSLGGAQVHVRDMSLWLKRHQHDPVVIAGSVGAASAELVNEGIHIEHVPDLVRPIHPVRDVKAVGQVRSVLRAIKPDILSCHSSKAGIIGRIAARLEGIPVVFTAHGWAFEPGVPTVQRRLYLLIEKLVAPLTDHFITVSKSGRNLAIAARVAPAEKITAIHNGIRLQEMPDRQASDHAPRIVMVARVAPQKDHATLISALGQLKEHAWELHLVGGGDPAPCLRQCDELGIRERVSVHGERADVPRLLADMDIFALISKYEGFPRSILEAMCSGLPVVASDVGGTREAVAHGHSGFLVSAMDVNATASALRELIVSAEKRSQFGQAGRKRFEESFTLDNMAVRTLQLYQKFAASPP